MAKFRDKNYVVEAITFEELVTYGKTHGTNIVNGMPWSFTYKGHAVTHENDECYLICPPIGTLRFTPADMLIAHPDGRLTVCALSTFERLYEMLPGVIHRTTAADFPPGPKQPPKPRTPEVG